MSPISRKDLRRSIRSLPRLVLVGLMVGTTLFAARTIHAAATPEQTCQKGRYDAAAKYSACVHKALAKFFGGGALPKLNEATRKCRAKYASVWPKLQAKAPGSTCDTARFTDNGATVTDNLTSVRWAKKTDDGSVHDKDNVYSWSSSSGAANGTVFTTLLAASNTGTTCLDGHCDWRLPTLVELLTIDAHACTTTLCIDPVLGPAVAGFQWSSTRHATIPNHVWAVNAERELQDFNVQASFITGKLAD